MIWYYDMKIRLISSIRTTTIYNFKIHYTEKYTKFYGAWNSDPDPTGEAYNAPPDPLNRLPFEPSALVNSAPPAPLPQQKVRKIKHSMAI